MSKIAITCGDPAGVGPEIIAAWLKSREARGKTVTVIGPRAWLNGLGINGDGAIAVGAEKFAATPGKPSHAGARVALAAMERAADGCKNGEFSAVVTGPVNKERLAKLDSGFVGQTEFFAQRWGGKPIMCFCGGKLRLALATWHIPLKKVPGALSKEAIARAVEAAIALARADEIAMPRIGVCGLNPHAGEGGLLGREESELIDPVLSILRRKHHGVSRALPGDTVFSRALKGEFDAVVALYHDQGLAPLKAVDFDESVNVTLGLPHIRTSPDHGTAYGIAGKGIASGRSFTNAVEAAAKLMAM